MFRLVTLIILRQWRPFKLGVSKISILSLNISIDSFNCRLFDLLFHLFEYIFFIVSFALPSFTSSTQSQESVFFVPCQCLIIEVQIVNYTPSCIMGQKIRKNAAASAPSILCSLSSHSWETMRLLYFLHDIYSGFLW